MLPKFENKQVAAIKREIMDVVHSQNIRTGVLLSYKNKRDQSQLPPKSSPEIVKRPGIIGLDEPEKIITAVNSFGDVMGFDYLVQFKQQPATSPDEQQVLIEPTIVKGSHLIVECPLLYRDFVESRLYQLRRTQINQ